MPQAPRHSKAFQGTSARSSVSTKVEEAAKTPGPSQAQAQATSNVERMAASFNGRNEPSISIMKIAMNKHEKKAINNHQSP